MMGKKLKDIIRVILVVCFLIFVVWAICDSLPDRLEKGEYVGWFFIISFVYYFTHKMWRSVSPIKLKQGFVDRHVKKIVENLIQDNPDKIIMTVFRRDLPYVIDYEHGIDISGARSAFLDVLLEINMEERRS
jgi:hypothetical protein